MYRKKVNHPIYGEIIVEEEDFLDFHRTLAGLRRLEDVAEEFFEHGVSLEDMSPGFIKVRDDGKEITYYKVLDDQSGKEMTLGTTQDEDRFPLYPRDDGFWEPSSGHSRPSGSGEAGPRHGSGAGRNGSSGGGSSSEGPGSQTTHAKLSMQPGRSQEAETIQQIRNAEQDWAANTLSEGHQKSIWRHCQLIRADDPKEALSDALSLIGEEGMEITYKQAQKVIRLIESPGEMDSMLSGGGGPDLEPNEELPF